MGSVLVGHPVKVLYGFGFGRAPTEGTVWVRFRSGTQQRYCMGSVSDGHPLKVLCEFGFGRAPSKGTVWVYDNQIHYRLSIGSGILIYFCIIKQT